MDGTKEDVALLARVAQGDPVAMRAFYERHHDAARRFAVRYTASGAEDAVQDAMLEVWRNAERFDGRAAPRTWLLSIVRNKATDRLRRTSLEVPAEPDETVPDAMPDPEAVTLGASDARAVRAAMSTLGPKHRAVLHLAFFEELSYPEIAAVEGVPLGTVKTRVMHAKRRLAHALAHRARERAPDDGTGSTSVSRR